MQKHYRTPNLPPRPSHADSPALQLSTRLNLEMIYVMGHCPPELLQDSIVEVASHKDLATATFLLENVVCRLIIVHARTLVHCTNVCLSELLPRLSDSDRHDLLMCLGPLAYLKTVNSFVSVAQFSNKLLSVNACREGWPEINTLGLLTKPNIFNPTHSDDEVPDFIHITIQNFLCALYLCTQPFIAIQKFVFEYLLSKDTIHPNHERALELYCGLITKIAPTTASPMLFCLISYICQTIDGSQPVCKSDVILLIFSCLYEAQSVDCVVKVDENLLTSRLFVYSVADVRDKVDAIAYYIRQTQKKGWKIFSTDPIAKEFQIAVMKLKGYILHKAPPMPSNIVIITTKEFIEIGSPLLERIAHQVQTDDSSLHGRVEFLSPPVPGIGQGAVAYSTSESQSPHYYAGSYAASCVPRSAYGYLSTAEYESRQYYQCQTHYTMLKDVLVISLQPSSLSFVEGQYRKKDHMWFSVSRNVRAEFYVDVRISPIPVVHWVKVKQPNGLQTLEEKIEKEAIEQRSTYSQETAELVILNSHRPNSIFLSSTGQLDPLVIAFDCNSGTADPGEIGCDGFMTVHAAQDVVTNNRAQFDIKRDRCVPRQLPLPASKSKLERNIETETNAEKPTPVREETVPPRAPAHHQSPPESTPPQATGSGTSQLLTRQDALKGFDFPGYCIFVDNDYSFLLQFRQGQVYPFPESLPGCRVLREGGNGLILDATVNGQMYIVKKTAFRLREIMIMPRLKHSNILRVMAMLVGPAMPDYPRRRFVYHYYKKMKGDLGRLVGSYEKYCLRTLNERYRDEPLLLSSVHANVQHIARSLLLGLDYLHTLSPKMVVHRDVKPSNVLVNMLCACPNPLVCVCRAKPELVLSDFDASLELSKDRLQPNSYQSADLVYHVSPVGTIGFKSPEGCLHCVGNDLDVMPLISTKLDIFSFGLLMMVLLLNADGPRHLQQMGTLLLSMNQSTTGPRQRLTDRQKEILRKHGIYQYRSVEPYVGIKELDNVLPVQRVKQEFPDQPALCDFMERCLKIDPKDRSTAAELLKHNFLTI